MTSSLKFEITVYYITKKKGRFSLAQSVHVASQYIVIYTGLHVQAVQAGRYYLLKLDLSVFSHSGSAFFKR